MDNLNQPTDRGYEQPDNSWKIATAVFGILFLAALVFGIAYIDPIMVTNKEMAIEFIKLDNAPHVQKLDKRNDSRLLDVLAESGRLR